MSAPVAAGRPGKGALYCPEPLLRSQGRSAPAGPALLVPFFLGYRTRVSVAECRKCPVAGGRRCPVVATGPANNRPGGRGRRGRGRRRTARGRSPVPGPG